MSKTLEEQIANRCVHFRAPFQHETCKAGVEYASVKQPGEPGKGWRMPCFKDRGLHNCPLAEFPTPEAVRAEVEESD